MRKRKVTLFFVTESICKISPQRWKRLPGRLPPAARRTSGPRKQPCQALGSVSCAEHWGSGAFSRLGEGGAGLRPPVLSAGLPPRRPPQDASTRGLGHASPGGTRDCGRPPGRGAAAGSACARPHGDWLSPGRREAGAPTRRLRWMPRDCRQALPAAPRSGPSTVWARRHCSAGLPCSRQIRGRRLPVPSAPALRGRG